MFINPQIFRTYDIRGLVDKDLDEEKVEAIGKAFGSYLIKKKQKQAIVGYDARNSSPQYSQAVIEGLKKTGINIIDIGLVPSPVFNFATYTTSASNGIMVTASHNPKEYNGFKFIFNKKPFFANDLQKLLKIIEKESFITSRKKGTAKKQDIKNKYINFISKDIKIKKPIKMVVDYGNGAGGVVGQKLYKKLGIKTIDLFAEPDGNFPHHEADPAKAENLQDLIKKIKKLACQKIEVDLGIAFDGDADRIGVVSEKGEIIWGDKLMILLSYPILQKHPRAKIVMGIKTSQIFMEKIKEIGGIPILWKTGNAFIENKVREEKALLGGEMSGHIFFADRYFGYDDALYAGARLCEILSSVEKTLSELSSKIPLYPATPEIRLPCPDKVKSKIVSKLTDYFKTKYKVIDIDGARILFDQPKKPQITRKISGWGLIRQSNTQPIIVLRAEGKTKNDLNKIKKILKEKVSEYPEIKLGEELD